MNFRDLHKRLRELTWRRIDQGVVSHSLLARQTGLAQPHISNFLHERRHLSMAAFDRILQAQNLSIEDLVADESSAHPAAEQAGSGPRDVVPIVSATVAMNAPVISPRFVLARVELPSGWITGIPAKQATSRRTWERFVAVRVTPPQAVAGDSLVRAGSLVVLDRHYSSLAPLKPPLPNLYAVRVENQLLFRHLTLESGCLILRPRALESPLEVIEVDSRASATNRIVGRVCLCIASV